MQLSIWDNYPDKEPAPFIRWAGGKRNVIHELISRVPAEIKNYYEPFLGGGALFYKVYGRAKGAYYLSDINFELIETYKAIRNEPYRVLDALKIHEKNNSREYYYKVRPQNALTDPVERAARFLYLNRVCFNGIYRVNRKNEFNVSYGNKQSPAITQFLTEKIELNNTIFQDQNVKISVKDFTDIKPAEKDFVYFDPPYYPVRAVFQAYSPDDFTGRDQVRLRDFAVKLIRQGVNVMLSNSYAPFILDLYAGSEFEIAEIEAIRGIKAVRDMNQVSRVKEVVITNRKRQKERRAGAPFAFKERR